MVNEVFFLAFGCQYQTTSAIDWLERLVSKVIYYSEAKASVPRPSKKLGE